MIENIKINWKNSFGIKQLEHEFKYQGNKNSRLGNDPGYRQKISRC